MRLCGAAAFVPAMLLAVSTAAAQDEPVNVAAEIARLTDELAEINLREGRCIEAARVGGTYGSSSQSTSGGFGQGGSGYSTSYSTNYSSPQTRAAACHEQAKAARATVSASIRHAKADPQGFAEIVRASRAQEREARARQVATFERALPAAREDLRALVSTPPAAMGLDEFSRRLRSLDSRLAALWTAAGPDGSRSEGLEAVRQAALAFRAVLDLAASATTQAEDIRKLEGIVAAMKQRLATRPSYVATAEIEAHEHNLGLHRAQLGQTRQRADASWREAMQAGNTALAHLAR